MFLLSKSQFAGQDVFEQNNTGIIFNLLYFMLENTIFLMNNMNSNYILYISGLGAARERSRRSPCSLHRNGTVSVRGAPDPAYYSATEYTEPPAPTAKQSQL